MEPKTAAPGSAGAAATEQRLAAVHLPRDLAGRKVLEIACGKGDFCLEIKRRGAAQVIGIDADPKNISAAKKQAAAAGLEIEFRQADVQNLPEGAFDVVLCLAAVNDAADPAEQLDRIRRALSRDGILILEAGIAAGDGLDTVRVLYPGGERLFPTQRLLREVWLKGYSFRVAGPGAAPAGDPVARKIYHCMREQVSVVMIHGDGGIGKSSLARRLGSAPVVSTDSLFRPARAAHATVPPAQAILDAKMKEKRWLSRVWDELRGNEQVRTYCATVIADAIRQCRGAGTVIVEGHVLADLGAEIETRLGPDFRCWSMTRGTPARRAGPR